MANTRSIAPTVVAVLLGLLSLAWLRVALKSIDEDWLVAVFAFASAALGGVTAIGLFHRRRWFFRAYIARVVLHVAASTVVDARVEPVLWKVLVGVVFIALVPVAVAFYLASVARRAA